MKKILLLLLLSVSAIAQRTIEQKNVEGLITSLQSKVDKVTGKALSTNDYTTTEKNKLAGIPSDAQTQINNKKQLVISIADLQAFTGNIADFDGSTWEKKSGDKTSNGGSFAGTLIRVSSSVYWERNYTSFISIKWFGAIGDGVTDDIIAINNTINYAKTIGIDVVIPRGTFIISSPILHYPRVKLIGIGIWSDNISKIKLKAGANCVMLKAGIAIDGTSNSFMVLENLVFDGNSTQQTVENDGIQFWGQYIGSYIKNVFINNVFGVALSLNSGDDLQIDHLWILGNKSSSGYGMTINNGLINGYDGTMNLNHIYIEWQRKTTDPTLDVYNSINDDKKSTGLYINRAITCNINDVHFEYCGQGIFLENNATVVIQNCFGGNMGRTSTNNEAMIILSNANGARTLKINNGLAISANTTYKWVDMIDKSGSNLNYFLQTPTTTVAGFLTGYTYSNIGNNATTKFEADLTVANQITIQGVGNYTPQKFQILANGTTKGSYIKQNTIATIIGSSSGQSSDKDFITLNSYGNAGDNITLNAPLTLGNRADAGYLSAGNIMLLNQHPAFTFGSNRVYKFVTTFSGSGLPTTTPDWIGQTYVDVTNSKNYFAKGTSSSADWIAITSASNSFSGNITISAGNINMDNSTGIIGKKTNGIGRNIFASGGDNTVYFGSLGVGFNFWNDGLSQRLLGISESGQLTIGISNPATTAKLDIQSITQGVLLPRMTTAQRDAITSPAEGLEIYNLTTHTKDFFNGTVWKTILTNL
jgi:hypothetical protein